MLSSDDLEAFTADEMQAVSVADVVIDRAKAGAPQHRHIMANEQLPMIAAVVFWKSLCERQAALLADLHRRQLEGLDVAPDQHRG